MTKQDTFVPRTMEELLETASNEQQMAVGRDEELLSLADYVQLQQDIENQIERAESDLAKLKESLKVVSEQRIPALMDAMSISKIKLKNGRYVEVKPYFQGSIIKEHHTDAIRWLRDQGYGDIIKHEVSCKFGMGEDETATKLLKLLEEAGYVAEESTNVHPSTMRAFVKELYSKAETLPAELFSTYIGRKTVIK